MYLDKYNLKGKVAVINGGARNIGFACAEAFAECGAAITLTDILPQVEKSAQKLLDRGVMATAHVLDLTNSDQVNEVIQKIRSEHERIDIVVNNAGIAFNTPAEEMTDEEWHKVVDINLNSMFWCNRAFGKVMLEQGSGSMVNVGSMSGIASNKPQPQSHYNATKAAVHMLTKSLAGEWARRGVRVNAVAPTYIATEMTKKGMENPEWFPTWLEMTPMNRVGEVHEIASAVLFLGSEASSLMTGSILVVDGGYTVW